MFYVIVDVASQKKPSLHYSYSTLMTDMLWYGYLLANVRVGIVEVLLRTIENCVCHPPSVLTSHSSRAFDEVQQVQRMRFDLSESYAENETSTYYVTMLVWVFVI